MYRSNEFLKEIAIYTVLRRKIFSAIYGAQERRKIRRHPILDKSKQIDYIYVYTGAGLFFLIFSCCCSRRSREGRI